jgi:hypothetical protein
MKYSSQASIYPYLERYQLTATIIPNQQFLHQHHDIGISEVIRVTHPRQSHDNDEEDKNDIEEERVEIIHTVDTFTDIYLLSIQLQSS